MTAPIKAVLMAIIVAGMLYILTHLAFFFPFYMTMVTETFNLANIAANDNYVKETYYDYSFDSLISRPMFNKAWALEGGDGWNNGNVRITVTNVDGERAVGSDNEFDYNTTDGPEDKPYRQRGEPIVVTVSAAYPFEVSMWNWTITRAMPVSFSITTVGLRYYKDLDYDVIFD
jgi:hypothetical protein